MKNSKDSSNETGRNSSRSANASSKRFTSSDETQNIESPRSASETSDSEISAGRMTDSVSNIGSDLGDSVLPEAFAANLPPESRENIERALSRGRDYFSEARQYIRENPAEAAGLIACSGAILWALFGTKPGRRIVEIGRPVVSRYLADGINQTFALQGRQLQ